MSEVDEYIRQKAQALGIDPRVALRVEHHEGGAFNPHAPDGGGDGHSSFGPFQLHYGGINPAMPHPGMGDDFTKATGLSAQDPNTWKQQVDFALAQAASSGWSPWMGAAAEGIHGMDGIGGRPSHALAGKLLNLPGSGVGPTQEKAQSQFGAVGLPPAQQDPQAAAQPTAPSPQPQTNPMADLAASLTSGIAAANLPKQAQAQAPAQQQAPPQTDPRALAQALLANTTGPLVLS